MVIIKEKDRVVLAYSARIINYSNTQRLFGNDLTRPENLLIAKAKGVENCIYCCWLNNRDMDVLRYINGIFKEKDFCPESILMNTVEKVNDRFLEAGCISEDEDEGNSWRSTIIAAKNDIVYYIDNGFVREFEDDEVFGNYAECARDMLIKTKKLPVEERLHKVAEVIYTIGDINPYPIVYMDTKSQKIKVLNSPIKRENSI